MRLSAVLHALAKAGILEYHHASSNIIQRMPSCLRFTATRQALLKSSLPTMLLLLSAAWCGGWWLIPSVDALLARSRQALAEREFEQAEKLCLRVLDREPRSAAALLLAGEAAAKLDRPRDAVEYFQRVPNDEREQAAIARLKAAEILLTSNQPSAAERELSAALACNPNLTTAHERLAWLLDVEGRRFEALPYHYALLMSKRPVFNSLMAVADRDVHFESPGTLEAFRTAEPTGAPALIGMARIALRRDRARSRRLLENAVKLTPPLAEAHALLGRVLWEAHDLAALGEWQARLPAVANDHPDTWLVRGEMTREMGQHAAAARAFWEALRRDPNHRAATYQLSRLLPLLTETSRFRAGDVRFLAERARQLEELVEVLDVLRTRPRDLGLIERAAELTESLGRLWESWGWRRWARTLSAEKPDERNLARIESRLSPSLPVTLASCDPGQRLNFSHLPLPKIGVSADEASSQQSRGALPGRSPGGAAGSGLAFRDVAQNLGLDFSYFRGCAAGGGDGRMFQFAGGGAAVIDFDCDGWPDLYLAQGCRWPPSDGQTEFLDELFRNQDGRRFCRVTVEADMAEDRFSHGVAVGDFNSDGFPDLYVANIGLNRLWMNCGDGTFLDVTAQTELADESWTTSVLVADLNGDGLADLYDVNYVMGHDVFERVCYRGGSPYSCRPGEFTAAPDRMLLNLGDGRFGDRSEPSGVLLPRGNGLGVVAADFTESGRLDLFVANDDDANFYFINQGTAADGTPRFEERGLLAGLAFDGQGRAQACMGVAAGDADGDGRIDLFVTNFYHDSNTLYRQQVAGLFDDATAGAGLREPSYEMLGFGAQFLDAELDGRPDLVAVNGHIDDYRSLGTPYAMRPQYFGNSGAGRFTEVLEPGLGPFFTAERLGRGLARLDLNRDGREDFVVSHLDSPAALVVNETRPSGHFLALRLHGVISNRDAIGARVRVAAGHDEWYQQLCAGDGYMASNERQLLFGVGLANSIDRLTIDWPSGVSGQWRHLPVDRHWIAVEGNKDLFQESEHAYSKNAN